MASVLAYGVSVAPYSRHLDLTPITAIVVAILVARFVVGMRLTPLGAALAAFAGALWAYLAEGWGLVVPSLAALVITLSLRAVVRRLPTADGQS